MFAALFWHLLHFATHDLVYSCSKSVCRKHRVCVKVDGVSGSENEAQVEVAKTCILSVGQQEATDLIANRL